MLRLSGLFAVVASLFALSTAPAQCQQAFPNFLTPMVGTAEAPKSFQASTPMVPRSVAYVITQNDRDTFAGPTLVPDTQCKVRAVSVNSMPAGSFSATLRGVDMNGTFTWDIGGQAKMTPDRYIDSWQIYNDRIDTHPQYDTPLVVNQVVTLTP